MNCAELRFLIDVHTDPNLDPMDITRFTEILSNWMADGLVEMVATPRGEGYVTTKRGAAWIKMMLATPHPIQVFVDPRDGKEP